MEIFEILNNLYTNPKSDWILTLDETKINPHLIQRFLALNSKITKQARFLNQFTYSLKPKTYLSTAWNLLFFDGKKLNKAPYIQYPKKEKEENYDFILTKIKKQYKMSDTDFEVNKPFLIQAIKKDKPKWFTYYGITKKYWSDNCLDVNQMKTLGTQREITEQKIGLDRWFT